MNIRKALIISILFICIIFVAGMYLLGRKSESNIPQHSFLTPLPDEAPITPMQSVSENILVTSPQPMKK